MVTWQPNGMMGIVHYVAPTDFRIGKAPSLLGEMGADLGNAKWESCNGVIGTALFTQVHKCLICRQCMSDCLVETLEKH